MKTIVHIIDSLGRGGAETLLVGVIRSLPQYTHVVISLKRHNAFEEELKDVRVFYLDFKWYPSIPAAVRSVRRILKYVNADVVHAHLYWSVIVSRLATPRHVKLINSYHAVLYGKAGAHYPLHARLLDKITYNSRIVTLCVSDGVRQNIKTHIGIHKNVFVLHNFIDDAFFANQRPIKPWGNTIKCVAVGNLKKDKNYGLLIEAFAACKPENGVTLSLHIFGDGPLRSSLEEQCRQQQATSVHFAGIAKGIAALLPAYDVFLLSSASEGFGLSVIEAMAVGLPVMVSDIPVLREVTGGHALFFDPNNAAQLTDYLNRIAELEPELRQQAAAGSRHALAFGRHGYLKKLQAFYE